VAKRVNQGGCEHGTLLKNGHGIDDRGAGLSLARPFSNVPHHTVDCCGRISTRKVGSSLPMCPFHVADKPACRTGGGSIPHSPSDCRKATYTSEEVVTTSAALVQKHLQWKDAAIVR
jgi:hypothetical protein